MFCNSGYVQVSSKICLIEFGTPLHHKRGSPTPGLHDTGLLLASDWFRQNRRLR